MALSYAEKAVREVAKARKAVDKLAPRYDAALARIEKKRATFAKQQAAMEKAEEKFASLAAKREQGEKYIAALEAVAAGQAAPADAPSAEDLDAFLASADEDGAEPEVTEEVAEDGTEDEIL